MSGTEWDQEWCTKPINRKKIECNPKRHCRTPLNQMPSSVSFVSMCACCRRVSSSNLSVTQTRRATILSRGPQRAERITTSSDDDDDRWPEAMEARVHRPLGRSNRRRRRRRRRNERVDHRHLGSHRFTLYYIYANTLRTLLLWRQLITHATRAVIILKTIVLLVHCDWVVLSRLMSAAMSLEWSCIEYSMNNNRMNTIWSCEFR